MSDQIQRLREVAEAATEGPWEHRFDEYGDDWLLGGSEGRLIHTVGPREYSHVALDSEYGPDAEHIATFDPPTVLELLDRLERAEAAVERVRATLTHIEERAAQSLSRTFGGAPFPAIVDPSTIRNALDGGER